MNIEALIFDYIMIVQPKFHYFSSPIWRDGVDIDKIILYNKVSFGKKGYKYFIGYKVIQLYITLPKMIGYAKKFDEGKYMS